MKRIANFNPDPVYKKSQTVKSTKLNKYPISRNHYSINSRFRVRKTSKYNCKIQKNRTFNAKNDLKFCANSINKEKYTQKVCTVAVKIVTMHHGTNWRNI
jgi:hypothetical protein